MIEIIVIKEKPEENHDEHVGEDTITVQDFIPIDTEDVIIHDTGRCEDKCVFLLLLGAVIVLACVTLFIKDDYEDQHLGDDKNIFLRSNEISSYSPTISPSLLPSLG